MGKKDKVTQSLPLWLQSRRRKAGMVGEQTAGICSKAFQEFQICKAARFPRLKHIRLRTGAGFLARRAPEYLTSLNREHSALHMYSKGKESKGEDRNISSGKKRTQKATCKYGAASQASRGRAPCASLPNTRRHPPTFHQPASLGTCPHHRRPPSRS